MSSKMLVVLPAMMLMGQLDLTNPSNIFYLRGAFFFVQGAFLLLAVYMYYVINQKNDQKKIKVPPPAQPSWAPATDPAPAPEQMSVTAYDLSELKKFLTQIVMSVAIVSFIHFKWEVAQPLFLQVVMAPFTLWENALFKIHIFGRNAESDPALKRPFPQQNQNPLASLFGQQEQPQANADDDDDDNDNDSKNNTNTDNDSKNNKTKAEKEETKETKKTK